MKRRNAATAISIVPKPTGAGSDAVAAIEARKKLEAAIEDQKSQAGAAGSQFAMSYVRGLQLAPTVDAEAALQKNIARKAAADRAQQRIEALESLLELVNTWLEELKGQSPQEVNAALSKKLEALEQTLAQRKGADKDLEDQIKKLKAEIN